MGHHTAVALGESQLHADVVHLDLQTPVMLTHVLPLQNFSSVVGPNGSGKSNVIDAMLFVFGKRAKQVRRLRLAANTDEPATSALLLGSSCAHPQQPQLSSAFREASQPM